MTPIEATVRLMETFSVTGKLADLNVGQVFDLTEQLFTLFSAQKPKRQAKAKPEPEPVAVKGPTHIVMDDPRVAAQAPIRQEGTWD